jgi:putative transposase
VIENVASVFGGAASTESGISKKDVEKLHAKTGLLVEERDFCRKPPVASSALEAESGEAGYPYLSVRRQFSLLSLVRSSFKYHPCGESPENLTFMGIIDGQLLEAPWFGSRHIDRHM